MKFPVSMKYLCAEFFSSWNSLNESKYSKNPNWAKNCNKTCPNIEINAFASKNDVIGFYLLSRDEGLVKLSVTKIGNVTNKSSYSICVSETYWYAVYNKHTVVNWMSEKRIIMLNTWKLVARPARQILKQWKIVINERDLVWKLLNNDDWSRYSSIERLAHSETIPPPPTANETFCRF
jgi:hypothetical protein